MKNNLPVRLYTFVGDAFWHLWIATKQLTAMLSSCLCYWNICLTTIFHQLWIHTLIKPLQCAKHYRIWTSCRCWNKILLYSTELSSIYLGHHLIPLSREARRVSSCNLFCCSTDCSFANQSCKSLSLSAASVNDLCPAVIRSSKQYRPRFKFCKKKKFFHWF